MLILVKINNFNICRLNKIYYEVGIRLWILFVIFDRGGEEMRVDEGIL